MAEIPLKSKEDQGLPFRLKSMLLIGLCVVTVILSSIIAYSVIKTDASSDYFLDTTLGELATWISEQSAEDNPESILGRYAQARIPSGMEQLPVENLLANFKSALSVFSVAMLIAAAYGSLGYFITLPYHRWLLASALVIAAILLFIFPPLAMQPMVSYLLLLITSIGITLLAFGAKIERVIGFLVILAFFLVMWEGSKAVANRLSYAVTLPVAGWEYTSYPSLDEALDALENGAVDVVFADRNDLRDAMPDYPPDDDTDFESLAYPDMRYVTSFERTSTRVFLPIEPDLPGRVAVAILKDNADEVNNIAQFERQRIGTVAESFVATRYFAEPRELILMDMGIANDLNLPHLQSIAEALLQPARRNGTLLLVRILFNVALYTWLEAFLGFIFGALFGFLLGTTLAHVKILQRSILPYVVASQTIPIIALAPMIVIWLRDTHPLIPVAVISSYLTFFPVTINTLRGLQSPDPKAFELMQSYAANRWQIMWKLRFPSALPYIFTALKVSATASVVGAIIGELPSGIRNGLGRAILDFSSDYSLISTPKLWGAIFMAALLGIVFFLIVALIELIVVGRVDN